VSDTLRKASTAALHALRSYQYGNGSPDLAKSVADHLQAALEELPAEPKPEPAARGDRKRGPRR
jgi:hypothetical protein